MSNEKHEMENAPIELIEYSKSMFNRQAADFDHLDNKSLGIMGVVGLLISLQALSLDYILYLVASLSKQELFCVTFLALLALLALLTLLACIIFFMLSIYNSFNAFQVRDLEYPTKVDILIKIYLSKKDQLNKSIIDTYKNSTLDFVKVNYDKAEYLKHSVRYVMIGLVLLFIYFVLLVIHKSF